MQISIPCDILRKFIADVLTERGNRILDSADILAEQELKEHGYVSEYVGEIETTSGGTYVLADDVMSGYISLDEALNYILSSDEVKIVKQHCIEWENSKEDTS